MILRSRAGETRHCSPSQMMEQVLVVKRVIVPMRSRRCLSVKLTVSPSLNVAMSARRGGLRRLPTVLGGISNNGWVGQLPLGASDVVLDDRIGRLQLQYAARHESATTLVVIHDLCTRMQVLSDIKNATRVGKHPVDCHTQFR